MDLIKPSGLKPGDKDILWRYHIGKKRLQEEFGLKVVEMPHTLSGTEFLYNMNFGHTAPMITIPYGVMAEIDCGKKTFCILEAGVR